ncbi:MAG: hypothetical protein ABI304_06195 [Rudaea sp.]
METRFRQARLTDNTMATLLWAWFAAGAILLVLFPPLRQQHPLWGWLPFWCVVAPLIDLAFVQRAGLQAAGKALRVRVSRRRHARRQAVDLRGRRSRWGMRRRIPRLSGDQRQR